MNDSVYGICRFDNEKIMILCNNLKLIFVKTKKVAGTSFEIALSKYCDKNDIVTPISPDDEKTRFDLGFQGPVNYKSDDSVKYTNSENLNGIVVGEFENHMSSEQICKNLGASIFSAYTKVSIHRDPLDFLISQFFFRNRNKKAGDKISFKEWLRENYTNVETNNKIAPTTGPYAVDVVLRYESLIDDIKKTNCLPDDFVSVFESLNAKGNIRDPESRDVLQFFHSEGCEEYIEKIQSLMA